MPLYMDFHQFDKITVEDVKQAHIADQSIQEKFGVKYLQFWVNEESGSVFCLVEGPDRESCEQCHKMAHGNIACNIQEVEPGFFKLFMGNGNPEAHGLVYHHNGMVDKANRILLVADIRGVTAVDEVKNFRKLYIPTEAKYLVVDNLAAFDGRFIELSLDDYLVGVFDMPVNAVRCVQKIKKELLDLYKKSNENGDKEIVFRLAIHQDQPLTKEDGFFEKGIEFTKRICLITPPNQITVTSKLSNIFQMEQNASDVHIDQKLAHILSPADERFLYLLFDLTELNLQLESFSVEDLSKLMGISRPQLYRKILLLTGKSPNHFIRDLRMHKAWQLLKSKKNNVSEIAYEVGYSNPSYFSKIFIQNFGHSPSSVLASF